MMNEVEERILAWCRSDQAKAYGVPCMRSFGGGLYVMNVNAPLQTVNGTENPRAIVARGETWPEVLDDLRARLKADGRELP